MTKIDLKTIIPIILQNIDFNSYLIGEGYIYVASRSTDKLSVYEKDDVFKEIIFITKPGDIEEFYSSTFKDSGNIIAFVKNRIEIDGTYDSFNPKKNNLIEACKKLIFFKSNKSVPFNRYLDSINKSDFIKFQNKTFTYYYDATPIIHTNFLNDHGIIDSTINSPFFKNRIYNTSGLYYNDKNYDVQNTVFPIYDLKNKETGLVLMNTIIDSANNDISENITHIVPTSDDKKGFWSSNNFKTTQRSKTRITLVDSPIEALSHYQIYEHERLYIAFFTKSEKAIEVIYKLATDNFANVHFAKNINVENLIYELRIILYFLSKKYDLGFERENENNIQIRINSDKHAKTFMQRIQRINHRIVSGVIKTLGDSSKPMLENDIIRASKDGKHILFNIPRNMQMLYEITKNLVATYQIDTGLIVEKSTNFTWNELNKKHPKVSIDTLLKDKIFGFSNTQI